MIEATRAHETRWTGRLTGAELKAMVREAIAQEVGAERYGNDLRLRSSDGSAELAWDDVTFELVHDHDWYMKEPSPPTSRGGAGDDA